MVENKILNTIKKYNLINEGDKIVLGVSGGPDSMCMLNNLNNLKEKLKFEIVVAHINHGIRENAKIDEAYVKYFCNKINVECFVLNCNVIELSKKIKRGTEETGRMVRYNYFNEILEKTDSNKIAIAHNSNDNAETMILNMIRGTGISGLKGILPKNGIYIRPLIELERYEIEEDTKNLNPRHDESNDENEYSRNKVRNIAIPFIKKEFNPNIIKTLNRLSKLVCEENDFVDEYTLEKYNEILIEEKNINSNVYDEEFKPTIILNKKKFNELHKTIREKMIFLCINKIFGTTRGIEKIHVDDIIKLCEKNVGNKYLTPNKYTKVYVKNNQIVIFQILPYSVDR